MIQYARDVLKIRDPDRILDLYVLSHNPNLTMASFQYVFWVCPLMFGTLLYSVWCLPLFLIALFDFSYVFARRTIPAAIVLHASFDRMSKGYLALKLAAKPMSIPHLSQEGDDIIPADWRLSQDCLRQLSGVDWREAIKYLISVCPFVFVDATAWSVNVQWEAEQLRADGLLNKTWFIVDEAADGALAWIELRRHAGEEVNSLTIADAVSMLDSFKRGIFPGAKDWLPLERLPGPDPIKHRRRDGSRQ
jgi:hypothetical protein